METLPALDFECRRPVWSALSELFLDTNLNSADLDRIAQSRYSLEDLDSILLIAEQQLPPDAPKGAPTMTSWRASKVSTRPASAVPLVA
jgi:hypothetical protein